MGKIGEILVYIDSFKVAPRKSLKIYTTLIMNPIKGFGASAEPGKKFLVVDILAIWGGPTSCRTTIYVLQ